MNHKDLSGDRGQLGKRVFWAAARAKMSIERTLRADSTLFTYSSKDRVAFAIARKDMSLEDRVLREDQKPGRPQTFHDYSTRTR